jgi:lipopolysaccharide assembly outer membrane protein LptD (OstA)
LKGDELIAQDVVITEEGEDYKVTAQRAVYNRATEQVQVEGGARFEDPETVATAPRAQIDARRRIAVFFGPVEVTIKPRKATEPSKAGSNPASNPPTQKEGTTAQKQRESFRERLRQRGGRLTCDRAEYYYRDRRVVATGNVQFEQQGRYKGRADKLIYLTRDEILTLEGNIVVDELTKGHRFQCPRAVINLQTDEAQFDPPVKVAFIVTEEEDKGKEQSPPKPQETPP